MNIQPQRPVEMPGKLIGKVGIRKIADGKYEWPIFEEGDECLASISTHGEGVYRRSRIVKILQAEPTMRSPHAVVEKIDGVPKTVTINGYYMKPLETHARWGRTDVT